MRTLFIAIILVLAGCGKAEWTDAEKSAIYSFFVGGASALSDFSSYSGTEAGVAQGTYANCMRAVVIPAHSYADWEAGQEAIVRALIADGTHQSCVDSGKAAADAL